MKHSAKPRQKYKHQPVRDARVAIEKQIAVTRSELQKRFFEYALDKIDFDRFAEVQTTALKQENVPVKHLDLAHFLYRQFRRAVKAGFVEKTGLNTLDLGCGIGTFSFAQKFLGHNVIGLDRPNTFFFDDMTSLLGITKLHHTIRGMEPLPPIFGLYVITAYSAAFPKKGDDACFTEEDWTFFFEDLKSRLNPGGYTLPRINDMYDLEGLHPTAPRVWPPRRVARRSG